MTGKLLQQQPPHCPVVLPFRPQPPKPAAQELVWKVAGQVVGWLGIMLLSIIGTGIWRIAYQFPMLFDRLERRIEQVDADSKARDAKIDRDALDTNERLKRLERK